MNPDKYSSAVGTRNIIRFGIIFLLNLLLAVLGGTASVRPRTNAEMQAQLERGLNRAARALLDNEECASLFGGGPYPSPITLLSRLGGSFVFEPIEDIRNQTARELLRARRHRDTAPCR